MNKYLVIGANNRHAMVWASRNGLNPNETNFTSTPMLLHGLSETTVFLLNGWETRKSAYELKRLFEASYHCGVRCIHINDEVNLYDAIFPRAMKLIRKQKPFIVIAEDETYYMRVYGLIRDVEIIKKTWSLEDEAAYRLAEERFNKQPIFEVSERRFEV